jgi:CHAT domain-containing protein/Tfp pilus assembly protein PilF
MRPLAALILVGWAIATIATPSTRTSRSPGPQDRRADSLFNASAYDSLLAYSQHELDRARARGDSLGVGRMTLQRARARQLLRRGGASADAARALAIATTENDSLGRLNVLGLQGFIAIGEGRLDESLRLNAERIDLARALGDRRSEARGHLLVGYAQLLRENLPTARGEYEQALKLFAAEGQRYQELTAMIGLARVLEREGNIDETHATYERALVLAQELGDRGQEADVWNNLATIEYTHGDLAVAERYFRRAYELKRAAGSFDVGVAAGNVASINVLLGSYAAAESVLVDVLAGTRAAGYRAGVQDLLCDLGEVRLNQGRYAGAIECYRSALVIPGSIQGRVKAAVGLASVLSYQGQTAQAVAVLDTHLVDLGRVAPSPWRAEAFVVWARCLRNAGEIPRAGRTARAGWDDAAARADTTRGIVAATELANCLRAAGEVERGYAWFQNARRLYVARGFAASEFRLREAGRVTLAAPLLSSCTVLLEWPREAKRQERERRLFDFLQEVKTRTLVERIADPRRAPDFPATFSAPVTAGELQAGVLHPGECLLDYTITRDAVLAFAVRNQALVFVRIANAREVEKQVSRYHRLLAQPPRDPAMADDAQAAARALGSLLMDGFADMIRGASRVYVATDGWLAALPVETLVCPGDADAPLISGRETVRVPSATLLRLQRGRAHKSYAGGDFASVLAVAPPASELEGARREINRLAARYRRVERFTTPDADAFIDAIGGRDVVHVASHVRVDPERPWNSGFLLARADAEHAGTVVAGAGEAPPDGPAGYVDAYARAGRIASARSDARLVVLSGCESALGRATQGEGVLGFSTAFFAAGARSVVASIWEVDDRATADLMEAFYDGLARGEPVAAALRSAQVGMRTRRPHPFYWAGFVVIGDGDVAVRLEPRGGLGRFALVVLGITVAFIMGWTITRRLKKTQAFL